MRSEEKKTMLPDQAIPYDTIIKHLNKVTGRKFRVSTGQTKSWIASRWKDGYRLNDFFYVHLIKAEQWLGTKWERYLQPSTLYTPNHFESYIQERRRPQQQMTPKAQHNAKAGIKWLQRKGFTIDKDGRARVLPNDAQTRKIVQSTD